MLKIVLCRLMEECKIQINNIKEMELNDETVGAYIFLNRQLNYLKEVEKKMKEEETKKDE